jgi:DNA-binding transcriptional LysR family regulator
VLREAALSGIGNGTFPTKLMRKYLYEGKLVRVMPYFAMPSSGYQRAYVRRAFLSAKARTFINHLFENLELDLAP